MSASTTAATTRMSLAMVMSHWRPGSGDWSWAEEAEQSPDTTEEAT